MIFFVEQIIDVIRLINLIKFKRKKTKIEELREAYWQKSSNLWLATKMVTRLLTLKYVGTYILPEKIIYSKNCKEIEVNSL